MITGAQKERGKKQTFIYNHINYIKQRLIKPPILTIKMPDYKTIFTEFLEEGINSESRNKFNPAVSNYYKALTTLCSYIINNKLRKTPNNHAEIFLFLKISFPEIYTIVTSVFTTYTDAYDNIMKKEDCEAIKNAIKEIIKINGIEEEFKEYLKKL